MKIPTSVYRLAVLVNGTFGHKGMADNESGTVFLLMSGLQRSGDSLAVIAVNFYYIPVPKNDDNDAVCD